MIHYSPPPNTFFTPSVFIKNFINKQSSIGLIKTISVIVFTIFLLIKGCQKAQFLKNYLSKVDPLPKIEIKKKILSKNRGFSYNNFFMKLNRNNGSFSTVTSQTALKKWTAEVQDPKRPWIFPKIEIDFDDAIDHKVLAFDNMENLTVRLKDAFKAGAEQVFCLLSNDKHCVAGVFEANGQFKIIDSMSSCTVNLGHLQKLLNASAITDVTDKPIQFRGQYIQTRIQAGGNECMRFASLYLYQMRKEGDAEAYKRVHGAFQAGLLKSFEDYEKISEAPKVENGAGYNYKPFMDSWYCREEGCKIDDWQDVPVNALDLSWNENINYYVLKKGKIPFASSWISNNKSNLMVGDRVIEDIEQLPFEKIPFGNRDRLKDHLPKDNRLHIIFVQATEEGSKRVIIRLTAEEAKTIFSRTLTKKKALL